MDVLASFSLKIQLFTLSMTENDHFVLQKGGMLNLYPGGSEEPVKILPRLDRLLLFWSDRRNPHEVAPSHDVRLVYNSSLSGTYDIYAIVFVVSRIPNKFVVSVISGSQKKKNPNTVEVIVTILGTTLLVMVTLFLMFNYNFCHDCPYYYHYYYYNRLPHSTLSLLLEHWLYLFFRL